MERHRAGTWKPERVSDQGADRLAGIPDEEYLALIRGPLSGMVAYHRDFHSNLIAEFSTIRAREPDLPSTFWEETRFLIPHRLHRYEAHVAQHTVQIEKTLVAIGRVPGEAKRLLRKIYMALAEVEGLTIGADKMDEDAILATASSISERTREIRDLL